MGRFLASSLAGILVTVGGWYGWSRADTIDSAVRDLATTLGSDGTSTESKPRGAPPAGMLTDPDGSISVTNTPAAEPCSKPAPAGAKGMDRLMDDLDEQPRLQGGDHGGSTLLADGRRMFVYGDTIRDPVTVTPFMVRNSVAVADGGCLQPMEGPDGDAAVPDDADGTGYWPMSLRSTAVDGGTRVEVITNRVRQVGADDDVGDDSFQTLGSSLMTFEVPTGRMPRLVDQVALSSDTEDHRLPTWGAAMWDHEGRTYIFGTASNEAKSTNGWSLHVARTEPETLGDPSTWEYWTGTGWTSEPPTTDDPPGELIPARHGVSHVLSVFERNGSWYAVSKEGDFVGSRLAVWKADSVTGPWEKHIIRPLENASSIQRYTPLAHPDFGTPSGSLLVSWSESPVDHGRYATNPELYRPEFDEIDLP